MIEDALKSTRNVQRLLLGACIVALVFLLSIDSAREEREFLSSIAKLRSLGDQPYSEFVEDQVSREIGNQLDVQASTIAEALDAELEAADLRVLGTSRVANIFARPAHIGRLRPGDIAFADDDTTLNKLDSFFDDYPLDRDVQLVLPDSETTTDELIDAIVQFVSQSTGGGLLGPDVARIENVQLSPVTYSSELIETYLPADLETTPLILQFELHTAAGIPIFDFQLPGHFHNLQDTSWLHWLSELQGSGNLFSQAEGQERWLPHPSVILKDRERGLASWQRELEAEIEQKLAKNQSIDVLPNVSLPGSLALLAIPIVLLSLATSLISHLQHLRRQLPKHRPTFLQFAWTPLVTTSSAWHLEIFLSAAFLPFLVQVLLTWRSGAFELQRTFAITWCLLGAAGSLCLGLYVWHTLLLLRRHLHRDLGRS